MSAEQPTVLPWHREAAKEIDDNPFTQEAAELAAIIARHDPHRAPLFTQRVLVPKLEKQIADLQAQHETALRLLERAFYCIHLNDPTGHVIPAHVDMVNDIRAHLTAQGGGK